MCDQCINDIRNSVQLRVRDASALLATFIVHFAWLRLFGPFLN
jgi:hypothetical protein